MKTLEWEEWQVICDSHLAEARIYTDGARHRRDRGEAHPVEDFLFRYYPFRDLDMRASPYDLSAWGVVPVKIETTEGRREYETEQRKLAEVARGLRDKLIGSLGCILAV